MFQLMIDYMQQMSCNSTKTESVSFTQLHREISKGKLHKIIMVCSYLILAQMNNLHLFLIKLLPSKNIKFGSLKGVPLFFIFFYKIGRNNSDYRPPLSKTPCRIILDIRHQISLSLAGKNEERKKKHKT